ncbi:hypothetical protein PACTADRAFT_48004 [Pachysolen tannophilus NRRL Y-2460]|uniref:Glycosyltransferase family 71 protein n=1 Tax=Pachysolen tannophilus NRRL Y-2460 TaxID=669874 RepID=A0A1E4U2I0_PACTA|nr:hypothetical protein PACTADRAFT_48004 [Pachysolen tannophilus NRRL Y-2460]
MFNEPALLSAEKLDDPSMTYNHLVDLFDDEIFSKETLENKCLGYFQELHGYDPNWNISKLEHLTYHRKIADEMVDFKSYYRKECENEWQRLEIVDKKMRQQVCSSVRSAILGQFKENKMIENSIFNYVGHLKAYNKCFIESKETARKFGIEADRTVLKNLEQRLFPWLTGKQPIFTRWTGQAISNYIPKINKDGDITKLKDNTDADINSFCITDLTNNMYGKGIVMTFGDHQLKEAINAIKVLRYLRNDLPIQIIHKGDLSQDSQNSLISIARENLTAIDHSLQELWFVDVSISIQESYKKNFENFANKWLSVLFNSFDEIFFLDHDATVFYPPAYFFDELQAYKENNAFFFRDREFKYDIKENYLKFYKSLLPSTLDNKLFKIEMDSSVLETNFFKGLSRHFVDSGVVLMKRSTHLGGILTAIHLQMWSPTSASVYGDKELFWLGQTIVGNSFAISENPAGSSGLIKGDGITKKTHDICSSQLTHISDIDNHSILWINGGLESCKVTPMELETAENNINPENVDPNENVVAEKTMLKIEGVIIPPDATNSFPNSDGEPETGWKFKMNPPTCGGYSYCAYEKVGPLKNPVLGRLIRYDTREVEKYNKLIEVCFA